MNLYDLATSDDGATVVLLERGYDDLLVEVGRLHWSTDDTSAVTIVDTLNGYHAKSQLIDRLLSALRRVDTGATWNDGDAELAVDRVVEIVLEAPRSAANLRQLERSLDNLNAEVSRLQELHSAKVDELASLDKVLVIARELADEAGLGDTDNLGVALAQITRRYRRRARKGGK